MWKTEWVVCEGEIEIRVTVLTAGDAGMHRLQSGCGCLPLLIIGIA